MVELRKYQRFSVIPDMRGVIIDGQDILNPEKKLKSREIYKGHGQAPAYGLHQSRPMAGIK